MGHAIIFRVKMMLVHQMTYPGDQRVKHEEHKKLVPRSLENMNFKSDMEWIRRRHGRKMRTRDTCSVCLLWRARWNVQTPVRVM